MVFLFVVLLVFFFVLVSILLYFNSSTCFSDWFSFGGEWEGKSERVQYDEEVLLYEFWSFSVKTSRERIVVVVCFSPCHTHTNAFFAFLSLSPSLSKRKYFVLAPTMFETEYKVFTDISLFATVLAWIYVYMARRYEQIEAKVAGRQVRNNMYKGLLLALLSLNIVKVILLSVFDRVFLQEEKYCKKVDIGWKCQSRRLLTYAFTIALHWACIFLIFEIYCVLIKNPFSLKWIRFDTRTREKWYALGGAVLTISHACCWVLYGNALGRTEKDMLRFLFPPTVFLMFLLTFLTARRVTNKLKSHRMIKFRLKILWKVVGKLSFLPIIFILVQDSNLYLSPEMWYSAVKPLFGVFLLFYIVYFYPERYLAGLRKRLSRKYCCKPNQGDVDDFQADADCLEETEQGSDHEMAACAVSGDGSIGEEQGDGDDATNYHQIM